MHWFCTISSHFSSKEKYSEKGCIQSFMQPNRVGNPRWKFVMKLWNSRPNSMPWMVVKKQNSCLACYSQKFLYFVNHMTLVHFLKCLSMQWIPEQNSTNKLYFVKQYTSGVLSKLVIICHQLWRSESNAPLGRTLWQYTEYKSLMESMFKWPHVKSGNAQALNDFSLSS